MHLDRGEREAIQALVYSGAVRIEEISKIKKEGDHQATED